MISFLQSQAWADFQKSINNKIWRIDEVLVIKYNLPFNKNYLYIPQYRENFLLESFLNKVRKIAKNEKAIFVKIEAIENFNNSNFIQSHNIQPQKTIILDITKSKQELLRQMHYKTRYNIGLAEKKGILIKKDKSKFEDFWKLTEQTVKRDNFHSHPKNYYEKMLEIPGMELFIAEFEGKIIAANIVVFYDKTAIYLHGASDYRYRNLMAPCLLQWSQILEAKKRGCIEYDFWGIDEKKWPGVTRFKRGFNGQEITYSGAYDLVFQPTWYGIYKVARRIL